MTDPDNSSAALLDEQQAYYRQRAPEYDQWWERRGRYDRGTTTNTQWFAEIDQVRSAFDSIGFDGDVLELAPGTGYWTEVLVRGGASSVTAVDGAPEMLDVNRDRLGELADSVVYEVADIFAWEPPRRYDGLVYCFWISHVPRDRVAGFFRTCRLALNDGAPMFFMDGRANPATTANDHVLPEADSEVMIRKLNDGSEHRIVKNFYAPEELIEPARAAGFELQVSRTDNFFQYGVGRAC